MIFAGLSCNSATSVAPKLEDFAKPGRFPPLSLDSNGSGTSLRGAIPFGASNAIVEFTMIG
jgi:hypothetical protein